MSLIFQQTDNLTTCGPLTMCSTGTVSSQPEDMEMDPDGVAGNTEHTFDIPNATEELGIFFQSPSIDQETWDAGQWTVNLNITDAQADTYINHIWICRTNTSCNPVGTIADEAFSRSIETTGVQSFQLSGTSSTGDVTDSAYIVVEIGNSHSHTSRTIGITPDQTVDSPIEVSEPDATISPVSANASVNSPASTVTAVAPLDGTVLEDFESYADTTDLRSSYNLVPTGSLFLDTTDPLEGVQSGRSESSSGRYGYTGEGGETPRFQTYNCLIRATDSTSHPGLAFEIQDPTDLLAGSYYIRLGHRDNSLMFRIWNNGALDVNETVSATFVENTIYNIELIYDEDGSGNPQFDITVYDTSDDSVVGTLNYTDTTYNYSDGVFGFISGRGASSTTPDYFDALLIPSDEAGATVSAPVGNLSMATTAPIVTSESTVVLQSPVSEVNLSASLPVVSTTETVTIGSPTTDLSVAANTPVVDSIESATIQTGMAAMSVQTTDPAITSQEVVTVESPVASVNLSSINPVVDSIATVEIATPSVTGSMFTSPPSIESIRTVMVEPVNADSSVIASNPSVASETLVDATIVASVSTSSVSSPIPVVDTVESVTIQSPSVSGSVTSPIPDVTSQVYQTIDPSIASQALTASSPSVVSETTLGVSVSVATASCQVSAETPLVTSDKTVVIDVGVTSSSAVNAVTPTVGASVANEVSTTVATAQMTSLNPVISSDSLSLIEVDTASSTFSALTPQISAVGSEVVQSVKVTGYHVLQADTVTGINTLKADMNTGVHVLVVDEKSGVYTLESDRMEGSRVLIANTLTAIISREN